MSRRDAAHGREQAAQPVSWKSSPESSRKRSTDGLLVRELLASAARVLGGVLEEVLEAALRVVGQRVDARDVLLRAGDAHRRAALGQRPRAAHGA